MNWTPEEDLRLKTLWEMGLMLLDIGQRMGLTRECVRKRKNELGLKSRASGSAGSVEHCEDCGAILTFVSDTGCPVPKCEHNVVFDEPERTMGGVVGVWG